MDMLINYQNKHPDPLQPSQDWVLQNNKPLSAQVMQNNPSTCQGFHPNTSLQMLEEENMTKII